jgi:uncharacterized protein (DUF2147 family)
MRTIARTMLMIAGICLPVSLARAESVAGTWIVESGKYTVRVLPCGGNLCGKIVGMKEPINKHGHPKNDLHNPNPALRQRLVIGLTVMSQLKPSGEQSWSGRVYNPDDGKTYNTEITVSDGRMRVKACMAFVCDRVTFTRLH